MLKTVHNPGMRSGRLSYLQWDSDLKNSLAVWQVACAYKLPGGAVYQFHSHTILLETTVNVYVVRPVIQVMFALL